MTTSPVAEYLGVAIFELRDVEGRPNKRAVYNGIEYETDGCVYVGEKIGLDNVQFYGCRNERTLKVFIEDISVDDRKRLLSLIEAWTIVARNNPKELDRLARLQKNPPVYTWDEEAGLFNRDGFVVFDGQTK